MTVLGCLRSDLNHDGRVDIADLAILMSEWLQQEDCNMSLPAQIMVSGITNPTDANGLYPFIVVNDGYYRTSDTRYISYSEGWSFGSVIEGKVYFVGDDGDANNLPTSWTEQPGYSGTVIVTEYTDTGGIMLDLYDEFWSW
jgi:hypothetical protein